MHQGLLLILIVANLCFGWKPAVLMHGIGATNATTEHVADLLRQQYPGIYVRNMEIGNGKVDSIFMSIPTQLEIFNANIQDDPNLKGGFNMMGFSQGGTITRGYLERFNDPPVYNYISWVSPQGGQFGVPNLGNGTLNNILTNLADCCIYDIWVQDFVSFASYWRNPYDYDEFVENCLYLPDINNLRPVKNSMYKQNFLSLQNFIMGYSEVDKTLVPKETGWFGCFANNTVEKVIPLEEQALYQEDWIGLKQLNETGRLHKFATTCSHGDYTSSCFDYYFNKYVIQFFGN